MGSNYCTAIFLRGLTNSYFFCIWSLKFDGVVNFKAERKKTDRGISRYQGAVSPDEKQPFGRMRRVPNIIRRGANLLLCQHSQVQAAVKKKRLAGAWVLSQKGLLESEKLRTPIRLISVSRVQHACDGSETTIHHGFASWESFYDNCSLCVKTGPSPSGRRSVLTLDTQHTKNTFSAGPDSTVFTALHVPVPEAGPLVFSMRGTREVCTWYQGIKFLGKNILWKMGSP